MMFFVHPPAPFSNLYHLPPSRALPALSKIHAFVMTKPVEGKTREAPHQYARKVTTGHTEKISSVAYSPDGTHIATGSQDKTVRIIDTSTGVG